MMTLNPFVENNKARINQFLNSLCEVVDFYETLEVRPTCYSDAGTRRRVDGSIHGSVQERSDDPYHDE